MVAKMFVLRVWYVYYTVQCGDAACAGAGNEMIINDNGWGYREKRSDDAVEGGVGVRGCGGAVEEQGEGGRGVRMTLLREDSEGREGVSVCG